MQVVVQLYARARDLAQAGSVQVDLADQANVADLKAAIADQYPALRPIVPHLHVAIGTDYASDSTPVSADSMLSCFPPVSGG